MKEKESSKKALVPNERAGRTEADRSGPGERSQMHFDKFPSNSLENIPELQLHRRMLEVQLKNSAELNFWGDPIEVTVFLNQSLPNWTFAVPRLVDCGNGIVAKSLHNDVGIGEYAVLRYEIQAEVCEVCGEAHPDRPGECNLLTD